MVTMKTMIKYDDIFMLYYSSIINSCSIYCRAMDFIKICTYYNYKMFIKVVVISPPPLVLCLLMARSYNSPIALIYFTLCMY